MGTAKKRSVDTHKAKKRKVGQNAEVMPRTLNSSTAIYSLKVRTIFSLFVLKKHMLGFAQIISVFRTGWVEICPCLCGYPVSGTCSRSSFCKWRTGACLFHCNSRHGTFHARELRLKKGCTAFLSKVKHKFVNNSCSN